jgi:hypothetical protein
METEDKNIDILLWGASQVGKTSALAAYLCDRNDRPQWIDRNAQETLDTIKHLSRIWNYMRKNMLPPSTVMAQSYNLKHRDGRLVRLRDMRGGIAENPFMPESEDDFNALNTADGMILFIEWPGQSFVIHRLAYENARRFARERPFALAITKVECHLKFEESAEFFRDPLGAAKRMNLSPAFIEILEGICATQIFPLSVYGYSIDGLPAHYWDEFGRLVPRNIRPFGIPAAFDSLLKAIL